MTDRRQDSGTIAVKAFACLYLFKIMAPKFDAELNSMFINIYKEYECLWRTDCEQYRDKESRDDAIAKIVERMGIPEFNENDAKKKIKSLRSTYLTEVKKIQDSLESGASVTSIYKPKIPWFKQMDSFIKYTENRIPMQKYEYDCSENSSDSDSDLIQKTFATPKEKRKFQPPPKRKKNEAKTNLNNTRCIDEIQQHSQDEFEIYGTYVASQLRRLSVEQGIIAREQIQSILTQSRLKDLRCVNSKRFSSVN